MGDIRPIGLFDSGVGGLTVLQEILRQLPRESTVYFGDNAHVPYGSRTAEELIGLAHSIISFLVAQKVKYIIFACNTNSSVSLPVLRKCFTVPMVGLIKPGAQEAIKTTNNYRIGVIATAATIKSGAYEREIKAASPQVTVFSQAAPRLVPIVESGKIKTAEAFQTTREYVKPLKKAEIDTLILGCSHYPFLSNEFAATLGPDIKLVDPATATVLKAREEMQKLNLLNNPITYNLPTHRFYVSGSPHKFQELASCLWNHPMPRVEQASLEE
ncbi:glutamate racemase [Peptococcaceae bacterium SCADC1_2_3]|nr:glutamate racemase [Peptococcaceae bacterium SCADC1_2_3]KFI36569.1 glutamate racemase [Peptococcaceae bacterium SCADC1_2_3]KFI37715.1 glutamate racemase [Peptococcaceae bacterium SCADC1_2_3]HBQ28601.1 glutamate racemase [Desulfotomaculum sp.]HCJ79269.1 glutamate racemase [Desulfotomaculum sp.]